MPHHAATRFVGKAEAAMAVCVVAPCSLSKHSLDIAVGGFVRFCSALKKKMHAKRLGDFWANAGLKSLTQCALINALLTSRSMLLAPLILAEGYSRTELLTFRAGSTTRVSGYIRTVILLVTAGVVLECQRLGNCKRLGLR
jgi:hypothetical protein